MRSPSTRRHLTGDRWIAAADRIVAATRRLALRRRGRWQRAPDDARVDASLLLVGLRGAVPADDPRSITTAAAIERELSDDLHCWRHRPDERALGETDGAFLVCGFWMALALEQQQRPLQAARWFERNRAACRPPGMLAEEFDATQRQMRGNLPQAFALELLHRPQSVSGEELAAATRSPASPLTAGADAPQAG